MPVRPKRSAVSKGERNVVEGPLDTRNLEQFMDEDGVLHNPLDGQGRNAWRNKPTSELQPPSVVFADATGITAEEGVPQPGPALDALHEVGVIDDDGLEQRRDEIEHPADIQAEARQARAEVERAVKTEAEERTIGHKPTGRGLRSEAAERGERSTSRTSKASDADKADKASDK